MMTTHATKKSMTMTTVAMLWLYLLVGACILGHHGSCSSLLTPATTATATTSTSGSWSMAARGRSLQKRSSPLWISVRGGDLSNKSNPVVASAAFKLPKPQTKNSKLSSASTSLTTDDSDSNNTNLQGVYLMALSSLSFSIMFLGVKLFSSASTFTLIFYRSVVQALLSGFLLYKEGTNPLAPTKATATASGTSRTGNDNVQILLCLRAAFGSVAVAAFFYAVQSLPLPDAITLQFTTPVFAALLAVPLLGEVWKTSDKLGAVICLTGVLMIARPSWLFGATTAAATAAATAATASATAFPTFVGLLGAVFAGLAYVLVRRIGGRADANTMVFYYALFSTFTAPLGSKFLSGGDFNVWSLPATASLAEYSQQLSVFLGLGLFGFLGQLFTNQGLTKCDSAATATLVTNTQIVFAFLFEIFILHESISPWSLAGTALIVGYMLFVFMTKKKD